MQKVGNLNAKAKEAKMVPLCYLQQNISVGLHIIEMLKQFSV